MKRTIERFAFATRKYGYELHADAGRIESWAGFVRDERPHRLDFHELLYIDNGRGDVWLDADRVAATGGRIVVTAPGQVRRLEITRPLEGFLVLFTAGLRDGLARELRVPSAHGVGNGPIASPLSGDLGRRVRRLLREMSIEAREQAPHAASMLTAQLGQLLILLHRAGGGGGSADRPHAGLVTRFRVLLEQHYSREHRPAFYANRLGVTTDHLSAVVRCDTGQSAGRLIAERVFLEGRRLLLHTDRSVASIAVELGFEDQSYFSRAFRRVTGRSPSDYRRQIAEKHSLTAGS